MRHIRYLYSNVTVCHEPERLGSEFVKVDFAGEGDPCRECSVLLVRHNAKQQEDVVAMDLNDYNYGLPHGPMAGASGIGLGAFLASLAWLIAILIVPALVAMG